VKKIVCEEHPCCPGGGPEAIVEKVGVEPTGLPFNSKLAVEALTARSVNPLVNAGAMATVSMVKADSKEQRWKLVHDNLSGFAGENLIAFRQLTQHFLANP
jgi:glutaminase